MELDYCRREGQDSQPCVIYEVRTKQNIAGSGEIFRQEFMDNRLVMSMMCVVSVSGLQGISF